MPVPDRSLAADRLDGAGQIAEFWYGSNTAESRKKIFRLVELKAIPAGKLGRRLVASKRALSELYQQLTSGGSEAAD